MDAVFSPELLFRFVIRAEDSPSLVTFLGISFQTAQKDAEIPIAQTVAEEEKMVALAHFGKESAGQKIFERFLGQVLDVMVFGDDKTFALFVGAVNGAVDFQDDGALFKKMIGIFVGSAFDALRRLAGFFVPEAWWIVAGIVKDKIVLIVADSAFDEVVIIGCDIERKIVFGMIGGRSGKLGEKRVDARRRTGSDEDGPQPFVERAFVQLHDAVLRDASEVEIGLESFVAALHAFLQSGIVEFRSEILGKFAAAGEADLLARFLPARGVFGAIAKIDAGS